MKDEILTWLRCFRLMQKTKKKELELRKKIAFHVFNGSQLPGTRVIENQMFKATIKNRRHFYVDKEILNEIWNSLSEEEKEVIKWTPEISITLLNQLPGTSALFDAVTSKPSTPSIDVVNKDIDPKNQTSLQLPMDL